jgi:hypothetical protein
VYYPMAGLTYYYQERLVKVESMFQAMVLVMLVVDMQSIFSTALAALAVLYPLQIPGDCQPIRSPQEVTILHALDVQQDVEIVPWRNLRDGVERRQRCLQQVSLGERC